MYFACWGDCGIFPTLSLHPRRGRFANDQNHFYRLSSFYPAYFTFPSLRGHKGHMKYFYFIALTVRAHLPEMAYPAPRVFPALTGNPKDTLTTRYTLQYDPTVLRVPGARLPIGIVTQSGNSPATRTKGFLKGKDGWNKLRIEVDGGSTSNGKIRFAADSAYKKGDSISVNVYTRKWLLGGKGKFLFAQKIPYDYEDSIDILTTGNIGRAPGDHVQFGVPT